MATYSTDELAHKVLAMYVRDQTGQSGQVLGRPDLLAQWPKGFTHVELTAALEYACDHGWLEQTETGFKLTQSGLIEP
jgi:hypothetical protein